MAMHGDIYYILWHIFRKYVKVIVECHIILLRNGIFIGGETMGLYYVVTVCIGSYPFVKDKTRFIDNKWFW